MDVPKMDDLGVTPSIRKPPDSLFCHQTQNPTSLRKLSPARFTVPPSRQCCLEPGRASHPPHLGVSINGDNPKWIPIDEAVDTIYKSIMHDDAPCSDKAIAMGGAHWIDGLHLKPPLKNWMMQGGTPIGNLHIFRTFSVSPLGALPLARAFGKSHGRECRNAAMVCRCSWIQ